jgi:hypothetical protein
LLIREEQLGLLESLILKVLEQRFWHNVTYHKQTQTITQYNATNLCYMNAQKERGSDSENFGTRITRYGVVVEKYEFLKFWSYF